MKDSIVEQEIKSRVDAAFERWLSATPRPTDIGFANGGGYLQHDPELIEDLLMELGEVSKSDPSMGSFFAEREDKWREAGVKAFGWLARFGSECSSEALSAAWSRAYCIDPEDGTEWGQAAWSVGMERGRRPATARCLNPGEALAKKEHALIEDAMGPGVPRAGSPRI